MLQIARDRLPHDDFVVVADCIPAISDLIAKAPQFESPRGPGLLAMVSRSLGGMGGLARVGAVFARLGLARSLVPSFVDVVLEYFGQRGGEGVQAMLRGVLR